MCSVSERTKTMRGKNKILDGSHILKRGKTVVVAVSIHPVPPADHVKPPRGLLRSLPVHPPQPAPLDPKKRRRR